MQTVILLLIKTGQSSVYSETIAVLHYFVIVLITQASWTALLCADHFGTTQNRQQSTYNISTPLEPPHPHCNSVSDAKMSITKLKR